MLHNVPPHLRSEDYFIQRPHHNFFNRIFYSDLWKKIVPFTESRSYSILERQRSAEWYGSAPQGTWVDGILDYTYNKHNVNSIGHFHMHENRKNKPHKDHNGGDATNLQLSYPKFGFTYYPKGCVREISNYKECRQQGGKDCMELKINVVEVCPKWTLELMREAKKKKMKATIIDNKTYRAAMKVEDYNTHRSLRDIKDKYQHLRTFRRDGYYSDDRYNPALYPAPDSNSNVNLGDKILFSDILGGNRIELITNERTEALNNA